MPNLKVGFPLYPGFDSLDVAGPFQTFTFAGMDLYLLGPTRKAIKSFEGISIAPRSTFASSRMDDFQRLLGRCLSLFLVPLLNFAGAIEFM